MQLQAVNTQSEVQYQAAQPLMWPDVTVTLGTTPLGARGGQYLTPCFHTGRKLSLVWKCISKWQFPQVAASFCAPLRIH